jgi:outer membrane protein OmpA-like peptidoglycan-associated protein
LILRFFLSALAFLALGPAPVCAQAFSFFDSFFIEGGAVWYFPIDELKDQVEVEMSLRGALGLEYRRFRLSLESGYIHFMGTNPLVLEIKMIPFVGRLGYTIPLFKGIGIRPDIGLGLTYSETSHYETALDMILGNMRVSKVWSLYADARLNAVWDVPGGFLSLYAGGGAALILETGGLIPFPQLQAGISLKPFALAKAVVNRPKAVKAPPPPDKEEDAGGGGFEEIQAGAAPEPENPPQEDIEIAEKTGGPGPPAAGESGGAVLFHRALYFKSNQAVLVDAASRSLLDQAGEMLKADSGAKALLRGYAAPYQSRKTQLGVSQARALECADYLARKHGIAGIRIELEWHGADSRPGLGGDNPAAADLRCVEIIIYKGEKP